MTEQTTTERLRKLPDLPKDGPERTLAIQNMTTDELCERMTITMMAVLALCIMIKLPKEETIELGMETMKTGLFKEYLAVHAA